METMCTLFVAWIAAGNFGVKEHFPERVHSFKFIPRHSIKTMVCFDIVVLAEPWKLALLLIGRFRFRR